MVSHQGIHPEMLHHINARPDTTVQYSGACQGEMDLSNINHIALLLILGASAS